MKTLTAQLPVPRSGAFSATGAYAELRGDQAEGRELTPEGWSPPAGDLRIELPEGARFKALEG